MSDTVRYAALSHCELLCNDEHDIEVHVKVSANVPVHQQVSSSIGPAHVTNRTSFLFIYNFRIVYFYYSFYEKLRMMTVLIGICKQKIFTFSIKVQGDVCS